jgi:hypothetical protein
MLLESRLSSLDVEGLGIYKLSGHTLVQYAGSLTGRDFRVLSQVVPFVIYDLVPKECYETWVSLSTLVPLIWQPTIENINTYLVRCMPLYTSRTALTWFQETLQTAIDDFLNCAAKWSTQWFNKPKFHILLHLPEHIRRFGPAILFATEVFESFNAVIRQKCVHSNRQAPSKDAGTSFAKGNRVRHMMSGGWFEVKEGDPSYNREGETRCKIVFDGEERVFRPAGPGPLAMMVRPTVVSHYIGIRAASEESYGIFTVIERLTR